jgi:hypothetical protein
MAKSSRVGLPRPPASALATPLLRYLTSQSVSLFDLWIHAYDGLLHAYALPGGRLGHVHSGWMEARVGPGLGSRSRVERVEGNPF